VKTKIPGTKTAAPPFKLTSFAVLKRIIAVTNGNAFLQSLQQQLGSLRWLSRAILLACFSSNRAGFKAVSVSHDSVAPAELYKFLTFR
jgi:hypothetical protein